MKRKLTSLILLYSLINISLMSKSNGNENSDINLNELALPSEVDKLGKTAGSIYYSPSIKGKVLIPVNIWGEVQKSGLHFIPVESTLIQGLSFAGGPTANADLETVKLSRKANEKEMAFSREFDLRQGGELEDLQVKLNPGDTIFIEKDTFIQDRAYYTSLIGVIATVLSSILLYREVRRN